MADLERDIFGGSDSELSEEEDLDLQQQQRRRGQDDDAAEPQEGGDESSASDSDEYQDESGRGKSKSQKRARRPRRQRGADEEGEDREKPSRKRKRKAPAMAPTEEELNEMPPEQAKQIRMDMRLDAILKPKKGNRSKKRKDEDILDKFADEEVSRLREVMNNAAKEDEEANRNKQAAIAKVKLLPEVLETLRKNTLSQSIVDNNLLQGVTRWLEPLPDKSLPSLNIQKEFFPILKRMEFIDSAVLKESGLGRIVLFYTKTKRATPEVRRIANELVMTWSRPIIKRSASYKDRVIPYAESSASSGRQAARPAEKLHTIMARAKVADKNRVRKNAVSIPSRNLTEYDVAPRASISGGGSVDADTERRRRNADRLRSLTRKVTVKQ